MTEKEKEKVGSNCNNSSIECKSTDIRFIEYDKQSHVMGLYIEGVLEAYFPDPYLSHPLQCPLPLNPLILKNCPSLKGMLLEISIGHLALLLDITDWWREA